jgi:hypothetical protein
MNKNDSTGESKRIKKLRQQIVKEIPKFPNNKRTKTLLENEPLSSLFVHYTNWAIRYIPPRKRKVRIEDTARYDPRWKILKNNIDVFIKKAESGDDLTPHLSLLPHTKGYTPKSARKANQDSWADKDFLLIVMGYHHFHLGIKIENGGFAERTNDLIIAKITRDEMFIICICDHSVFNNEDGLTSERKRLWKIFTDCMTRGMPPRTFYVPYDITTSGHSGFLVDTSIRWAKLVRKIDPEMDNPSFAIDAYNRANLPCPKDPKISWHIHYLDLGYLDSATNTFFIINNGPM